jgi:hypothetical protein
MPHEDDITNAQRLKILKKKDYNLLSTDPVYMPSKFWRKSSTFSKTHTERYFYDVAFSFIFV